MINSIERIGTHWRVRIVGWDFRWVQTGENTTRVFIDLRIGPRQWIRRGLKALARRIERFAEWLDPPRLPPTTRSSPAR
jgi:hypothetical protein